MRVNFIEFLSEFIDPRYKTFTHSSDGPTIFVLLKITSSFTIIIKPKFYCSVLIQIHLNRLCTVNLASARATKKKIIKIDVGFLSIIGIYWIKTVKVLLHFDSLRAAEGRKKNTIRMHCCWAWWSRLQFKIFVIHRLISNFGDEGTKQYGPLFIFCAQLFALLVNSCNVSSRYKNSQDACECKWRVVHKKLNVDNCLVPSIPIRVPC